MGSRMRNECDSAGDGFRLEVDIFPIKDQL